MKSWTISPGILLVSLANHFVLILLTIAATTDDMFGGENWLFSLGWISILLLFAHLISLRVCRYSIISFQMVFLLFLYTFMLGRIILAGVSGIDEVFSEGRMRRVIPLTTVNENELRHTVLFILACIQGVVCGFISGRRPNETIATVSAKRDVILYRTGIAILAIGIPCHVIYSMDMIRSAQQFSSYNAITQSSGLVDDFSNFVVPGLLCLLYSNMMRREETITLYTLTIIYLITVMILTGDRRYQAVAIVVLTLAYIAKNDIRFSWKHVLLLLIGIVILNICIEIRQTRNHGLESLSVFLLKHYGSLLSLDSGFLSQSLYEYGVSIYSVAYTLQAIPATSGFRMGATFLRGIIMVIPLGFLYQKMPIVRYGGIASAIEEYSGSSIGGAMIGDLYGNFGTLGAIGASIVVGIVFNRIMNFGDDRNGNIVCVKYYTSFFTLIHLARASFSEVIRTTVWCVGVVYALYWIIGGLKDANKSAD